METVNKPELNTYDVKETKTITLVHRIRAKTEHDAISRMEFEDKTKGQIFIDVLEDSSYSAYTVVKVDKDGSTA